MHKCEFCKRSFNREDVLINHSCEIKRRWFAKEDPVSRLAFIAWSRFYELSMPNSRVSRTDYREFIDSRYYTGFYKFGKYLVQTDPIDVNKFIDFVIKGNIPMTEWTNEKIYNQYVAELIKKEEPEAALERNIELMQKWSQESGETWTDFFRKVGAGSVIQWLKRGRLSPWVLYNAPSAEEFFERCSAEQITLIKDLAPIAVWKIKFSRNTAGTKFLKETLAEAGL